MRSAKGGRGLAVGTTELRAGQGGPGEGQRLRAGRGLPGASGHRRGHEPVLLVSQVSHFLRAAGTKPSITLSYITLRRRDGHRCNVLCTHQQVPRSDHHPALFIHHRPHRCPSSVRSFRGMYVLEQLTSVITVQVNTFPTPPSSWL